MNDDDDTFSENSYKLRDGLRVLAQEIKAMHEAPIFKIEEDYPGQHQEMHANITLAYRHVEDATMRMGKAIQAYDGGTSVYPR